jgi:ABC-type sulfate/molybdate transport systems ATPase subunit
MVTEAPKALEVDVAIPLSAGRYPATVQARFTLANGILVIFGPSATGKTLTVRAVAGLVRQATGTIRVCGETLLDTAAQRNVAPEHRRVGYVPQHTALFPHLNVRDNVAFGLRARGNGDGSRPLAEEWLDRLGVAHLAERMPRRLSGGEAQRVSLARALAPAPRLLLLDEPFASLDLTTRREMRRVVREVQERSGVPMVFVTHSPREAIEMGDHLVRYGAGGSQEEGRPEDLIESDFE